MALGPRPEPAAQESQPRMRPYPRLASLRSPSRLSAGFSRHVERERLLPTESEFIDAERDVLLTDSHDLHPADDLAYSHAISVLVRPVLEDGDGTVRRGNVIEHADESEVREQRPQFACRKQREKRIAPVLGIVREL